MTPQEQALGDLLRISLFKLADQFHETLARLKERHPTKVNVFDEIDREVEGMIDAALEDYKENRGEFSMATIDDIHARIIATRRLLDY